MPEKNRSAGITVIAILAAHWLCPVAGVGRVYGVRHDCGHSTRKRPATPAHVLHGDEDRASAFLCASRCLGNRHRRRSAAAQKLGAYFHHCVFRSSYGVWRVRNPHVHGLLSQTASRQWRGPQNVSHHWSSHGRIRSGSNRHRHLVDGLLQSRQRKSAVPAAAVSVPTQDKERTPYDINMPHSATPPPPGLATPGTALAMRASSTPPIAVPQRPARPLSISIIAWFILAICVFIPFNIFLIAPVPLFHCHIDWLAGRCIPAVFRRAAYLRRNRSSENETSWPAGRHGLLHLWSPEYCGFLFCSGQKRTYRKVHGCSTIHVSLDAICSNQFPVPPT